MAAMLVPVHVNTPLSSYTPPSFPPSLSHTPQRLLLTYFRLLVERKHILELGGGAPGYHADELVYPPGGGGNDKVLAGNSSVAREGVGLETRDGL